MTHYSQTLNLRPTKVVINSDTLRCFNTSQSKFIAKQIVNSRYCDTLELQYNKTISALDTVIIAKDVVIETLKGISDNQQSQLKNCGIIIDRVESKLKKSDKLAKRYKKQRMWCFVGGIVIGLVPIIFLPL